MLLVDEKGMTYNPLTHRWEGNESSLMTFENPSTLTLPGLPTHGESYRHHHHNNSIPSGLALGVDDTSAAVAAVSRDRKKGAASPPRPALISGVGARDLGVRVERGMVFDPEGMRWLRLDPRAAAAAAAAAAAGGGAADLIGSGVGGAAAALSLSLDDDDDPFAGLPDLADENTAPRRSEDDRGGPGADVAADFADWVAVGEEFDVGPGFIKRQRLEEGEWRRRVEPWMGGSGVRDYGGVSWKWAIRDVAREYEGQLR